MIPRTASTRITIFLGILISAISLVLVAQSIDLAQLGGVLSAAHLEWIGLGLIAISCTIYARVKRWKILLLPNESRDSTLTAALLIGQLLNFLLPLRVGDIIRSILAGRSPDLNFERALGSVAIEKALDWITLTLIVLIVTFVAPLPDWFIAPARIIGLIACLLILVFTVIAFLPESARIKIKPRLLGLIDRIFAKLPNRFRVTITQRLLRLWASLEALRNHHLIWQATVWSLITWSLSIVANTTILHAFGIDSLPVAMLLLVVLMIGVALPPSIAALGIFEGLTILTLNSFGISNETALAAGLTLHIVMILPAIIVGSIFIALEAHAGRAIIWRRVES